MAKQEYGEAKPKNQKLTKAEKETITVQDCESDIAIIYSANPVKIRKFKTLNYTLISEDEHGARFECPNNCISFRKNEPKKKRVLTDEQKRKLNRGRSVD